MTEQAVKKPGLIEELIAVFRQIPHKVLFLGAFGAWAVFFHFLGNSTFGYIESRSLFEWLQYCYEMRPDDAHGQFIPLVVLVLFWLKRADYQSLEARIWWPALFLVGLAVSLHIVGYAVQQARLSVAAFCLGAYAFIGLAWGPSILRASFFPMILLLFCVPLGTIAETITFPLRILVTKISVGIGHNILGIDVFRNGSQIFDGKGVPLYDVAPACSGIRSLISLLALTIIYGFMTFKAGWKRLLLILMTGPIAVAGNAARITTVIIVGEAFGQDAGVMIEQKFGFITFAVAIGAIMLLGWLLQDKPPAQTPPSSAMVGPNPTPA